MPKSPSLDVFEAALDFLTARLRHAVASSYRYRIWNRDVAGPKASAWLRALDAAKMHEVGAFVGRHDFVFAFRCAADCERRTTIRQRD
jgi:tRNA U38,U39,U40 pseudouridine synthase TruA